MGYVLKTTFWLGLVYSAMPLGEMPDVNAPASAATSAALCAAASEALVAKIGPSADRYRDAAAKSCAAFAAARSQAPAARPPAAPTRPSADTLVALDREPPWLGPRPPQRAKSS